MHITKVELENIKSHAEATFEFERGTTAITGENGAGKTTIIEAVAWTLFDLLDYKKDDFVRRGEKKGSARVTFESGLDERLYTVYRDTGTGYYVFDPALGTRIADKKEEVSRFLWQHLGVEPGTDLESLFRRAIGVPQGTFTAIFLETPAERKRAFDKLLKVEEYRQGAEELLRTARFIEQQIQGVIVKIARAEGEIARMESIESEHKMFAERSSALSKEVDDIRDLFGRKRSVVSLLDETELRVSSLRSAHDELKSEVQRFEIELKHSENEVKQAKAASEAIQAARPDAEKHAAALGRQKELERERTTRENLRLELSKTETALARVVSEQKHIQERLENIQNAHAELESLAPKAVEQEQLEREVLGLRQLVAQGREKKTQIASLETRLDRFRHSFSENRKELAEIEAKVKDATDFDWLRKRDAEIVQNIARFKAELDRDLQFQKEIKNGLCPILSQKCLNLKEGETLEGFVKSQFVEIKARISALELEHSKTTTALKESREADNSKARKVTLEKRGEEITDEGKRTREEKDHLEKEIADLPEIEKKLLAADSQLVSLDNPKARIKALENDISREGELRQNMSKIEQNLERLESDRRIQTEQLESYKDLDSLIAEANEIVDATAKAHSTVLANEGAAASLVEREQSHAQAENLVNESRAKLAAANEELTLAAKDYDRERHLVERVELQDLQQRQAELRATFEAAKRREDELAAELNRLTEIRRSMQTEFRERERHEATAEATEFIRTTLKEAAPLVARNYVYRVSLEANQMFREISGNAEQTLKWGEDYGIFLEEAGHDRPFISLSGGEQMAAALSVRLALLKQLTDIRIAFFDEPTTNMDAERRENLAQQIGRIGHFDQLFVISHDDTFDGYVDNVLAVEKH
jgi:exonuclease SbcC